MTGTRELCLEAGMDDYMSKPISGPMLDGILERWLEVEPASNGAPHSSSNSGGVDPGRLDQRRLDELHQLFGDDKVFEVIDQMAQEVSEDMADLATAIDGNDQGRVAGAAHRIRNNGRVIGATALVDAAAPFDRPLRDGVPPAVFDTRDLTELQHRWEDAQEALAALPGRVRLAT
jgi:HPt (histidine-containing phosphotransfer) domain-containing protein